MTSFRTRPKSSHYVDVDDISADPYAYFLQGISARQYKQNLEDRGYDSSTVHPDTGHTLDMVDFRSFGQRITGRVGTKPYSNWEYVDLLNMLPALTPSFDGSGPFSGSIGYAANFPGSDLSAFAQKAYARSAPTYEQFNLSRALVELRELPRVKLDFLSKSIAEWRFQGEKWLSKGANRLGDDSLNILFGWAPLVSDILGFTKAMVAVTNGMIEQPLVLDPVHRTYHAPVNVQTSEMSGTTYRVNFTRSGLITDPTLVSVGPAYGEGDGPPITWSATKRLTREQWFEASFTKFLPIGFDASNYLSRAHELLNVELTPLTLWNLAPWTWLSDWYVDVSSTIASNQAASDKSLISHYAYAMERTRAEVFLEYEVQPNSTYRSWSSVHPSKGSLVASTTWKKRIRANPFGFVPGGPGGLNPFRTAVLAALGLSRL